MSLQDPKPPKSSFGFEAPEDSPGFMLWQTTVVWQRLIKKALDEYDITHTDFVIMANVLWFEEHHEDVTQIKISRLSKLDKMTVSKALKKLVAQGYVVRMESAQDTRAKSVTLTVKGKKLITKLVPVVEKVDEEFFGCIPKSDQTILIRRLNSLISNQKGLP